jgi:outer membrane receptor for ferrienterochelin and colicins
MKIRVFLFVLFTPLFLFGQENSIFLFDQKSKEPIIYANLLFTDLSSGVKSYSITDAKGKATNICKKKCQVTITYIGYATLIDTILPGESKKYYLDPTSIAMTEMVVTAQYTPTEATNSVYKVKIINEEEIKLRASNNLSNLLNDELNLRIEQDNIMGSNLSLQGIGGENVKILVDGVPVIGRMNGSLDLSQINVNNIERVEMIEGPMSVNYGTNALAGVINLITKDNVEGVQLNTNAYYESVGQYNLDANIAYGKDKNNFQLNGGRNFFSGYSFNGDSRFMEWNPKEQYFTTFKYRRNLKTRTFKYKFEYFDELVWDKGSPFKDADTNSGYYYYLAKDGKYRTQRMNNNINYSGTILKNKYIDILFSHAYYEREKRMYFKNMYTLDEKLTSDPADHDTNNFNNWLLRGTLSQMKSDSARFNFQLGYDFNFETATGEKIEGKRKSIGDYAVFGSFQYKIRKSIIFQPALRYAYNTEYEAPVTPSLNIKFTKNNVNIRASYARGFRAPSLKELYLDFVDINHKIFGNQDLKAESSDNYSLNISYQKVKDPFIFKIEPAFFFNQISDLIGLIPKQRVEGVDTNVIYLYSNFDKYSTIGGRMDLGFTFYPKLYVNTGFAYTGLYNSYFGSGQSLSDFEFYPEFSSNIKYVLEKYHTIFFLTYKYTGEIVNNWINLDDEVEKYTEADYHTLDFSISKSFKDNKYILVTGVKNILDVKQIATTGAAQGVHSSNGASRPVNWGRTFFLNFKYNFQSK